jgi:hypothetical protein
MPCCLLVGGQRRQFKSFRADDAGAFSACQSAADLCHADTAAHCPGTGYRRLLAAYAVSPAPTFPRVHRSGAWLDGFASPAHTLDQCAEASLSFANLPNGNFWSEKLHAPKIFPAQEIFLALILFLARILPIGK